MTHDELLDKVELTLGTYISRYYGSKKDVELRSDVIDSLQALRAVVELHKPTEPWGDTVCGFCFDLAWEPSGLHMDSKQFIYPCPTIQAIEKELTD